MFYLNNSIFKILTFISLTAICSLNVFAASTVSQTELKTHLRWKISAKKEIVQIKKKGLSVTFRSLDPEFFEKFSKDITKIKKDKSYHTAFTFTQPKLPGNPYTLRIDLKDDSIELFTFYKQTNSEYVLDFWINKDIISARKSAIEIKPKLAKKSVKRKIKKVAVIKKKTTVSSALSKPKFNVINPTAILTDKSEKSYRDFRYGAAFIWDYAPLIPNLPTDIDLSVKAPDYLYKIKDYKFLDNKREAHMQLSINFYRKKKWGLMTRSINLYEEKYGSSKHKALNDFMKATSIIKNTIKSSVKAKFEVIRDESGDPIPPTEYSKKGLVAAARNLLSNVLDRTQDYELSQSVLRYLIQYTRNESDHINALEYAKSLYVKASEAHDDEMIVYSSRVILNSLANLKLNKKISEFLSNKAVSRVLSKQEGMAYRSYVHLVNDNTKQIISDFVANQKSMIRPIHPSILFNTAESYFRQAKYKKAIRLFDEYISQYSFYSQSSHARLRIAMAYDLNGGNDKKILRLYRDAINKSSELSVRYEAKLRYVGFRAARKRQLNEADIETINFIDATTAEKSVLDTNLKMSLWLVRLRTLINTHKYEDALAYLTTLPLDSIRLMDKRTFEADGAEIVLGIIQKAYLKGDYTRSVKVWELYKSKYEKKVAKNPYMNFIVADSFLKLGLLKSHERAMTYLENLQNKRLRSFPRWVNAHKKISIKNYLVELKIGKLLKIKDYKGLLSYLETQKKNKQINYKFYKGLVWYKLKNYNNSVTSFESILVTPNEKNYLTPGQSLQMFEGYLESLYQSANGKRFRKNASALANDLRVNKNQAVKQLLERTEYLYIESVFSESKINYPLLSSKTAEFLKDHTKSAFQMRIKYLSGISLLNRDQVKEGKKVLNSLITQDGVPEYLKGLARSELSTLAIKDKRI